jgi:hypothetical protein
MENLNILKILVQDSPKTNNINNKNLFKFLNLNYMEIIQSYYYIHLILLNDSNISDFAKYKIKNTPVLIKEQTNTVITGTTKIIEFLIKECEDVTINDSELFGSNEKKASMQDNDVQDYLMNEVMAGDDSIEEPLDLNKVKDWENKYKLKQEKNKTVNPQLKSNMMNTHKSNLQPTSASIDNTFNQKNKSNTNDNDELTVTRPVSEYMSDDKDLQKFWENMETT